MKNTSVKYKSIISSLLPFLLVIISATSQTVRSYSQIKDSKNLSSNKTPNMYRVISPDKSYLNLEKSIAIAMNNNFELKAIRAQRKVYDLTIIERLRDYFPTLSLSYLQTEESVKRDTDTRQHMFSADAEIILYEGGKRSLSYDVAKLKAILARNDYRLAVNTLVAEIRSAYFNILQLRDSITIHEKTLEYGNMQLQFITKELKLGEATRFDKMEIEAKVKEVELNLEKAKDDYTLALNRFKLMLKIDWRQDIEVTGDIEKDFIIQQIDDSFNIDMLTALAVKNRKEIESSKVNLAIKKRTYLIKKLYYFPRFSVGLNYSLSDDKFMPREKGWGINFKVTAALWGNTGSLSAGYNEDKNKNSRTLANSSSINVLNDLAYKRNIAESRIELNRSRERQKDTKQQISIEVTSAYTALKNSWTMIEIAKKQLKLYDAQLNIERLKANMGESRRYDLMKKEIERGEAAIAYLQSLIRYLTTASTLETALGVDVGFLKLLKMK